MGRAREAAAADVTAPDPITTLGEAMPRAVARIRASEALTGPGLRHRWNGIAIGPDGDRWCVTVTHEPRPSPTTTGPIQPAPTVGGDRA